MDKIKDEQERLWYAEKTLENLWSRTILEHQIGTDLYNRQAMTLFIIFRKLHFVRQNSLKEYCIIQNKDVKELIKVCEICNVYSVCELIKHEENIEKMGECSKSFNDFRRN